MIPAFICPLFKDIFKERKIIPILIDVEKDTVNISSRTLKKNFDKSARALITNNMNGLPCEVEKLKKILNNDQILIEDCAHSLGAYHKGKPVGTFGDAAFFSLYKNLPTISGGFALTEKSFKKLNKEKDFLKTIIKLIYYLGKISHFYKLFKEDKNLYEKDMVFRNIKSKRPNILVEKIASFYIKNLHQIINSRRRTAKILEKEIKGLVELQSNPKNEHIYTYFSFLLPKEYSNKRGEFLKILRKKRVIGRIIWNKPLAYFIKNKCKNTKEISERIVGIPINANYSKEDAKSLAKTVKYSLNELKLIKY